MHLSSCLPGHPGARLLVWLASLLASQGLTSGSHPQLLPGLLLWLVLLLALPAEHRTQVGHLLRRTRWLLLSLFLIFAFATPGAALLDTPYSPSHEGLTQGLAQLLRLTLILTAVAILLASTPIPALMAACHQWLRPFTSPAVNDRLVVRLMLVLHYAEHLPPANAWRQMLAFTASDAALPGASAPERIQLSLPPWQTADWLWPLAAGLIAASLWSLAG